MRTQFPVSISAGALTTGENSQTGLVVGPRLNNIWLQDVLWSRPHRQQLHSYTFVLSVNGEEKERDKCFI